MSDVEAIRAGLEQGRAIIHDEYDGTSMLNTNIEPVDLALSALRSLESQNQALQERVKAGRMLVESMDRKMGERETSDEDGWITGYQLPVGPWHRLLAWARQGEPAPQQPMSEESGE